MHELTYSRVDELELRRVQTTHSDNPLTIRWFLIIVRTSHIHTVLQLCTG
jgi:hypothetical protein